MPSAFKHTGLAVGRILAGFCSEMKTSPNLEDLKTWPLNDWKMQVNLSCNHNVGAGMEFQLEVQPNPFVGSEWPLHNFVFGIRLQNLWSRKPGRRQKTCAGKIWKIQGGNWWEVPFLSLQTLHSPSNGSEQIKGKRTQHMDPKPTNCWK